MYAVIRTGGKQYRVAPGDVVKIETVPSENRTVEFSDVLAVSGAPGSVAKPSTAKVTAEVLGEGRRDKILSSTSSARSSTRSCRDTGRTLLRCVSRLSKPMASPIPPKQHKIQKGIRQWHIKRVEAAPQTDGIPMHSGWA